MMFMGPNVLRRNAKKSAPQPIIWCHNPYAEMLLKVRTQGKGQVDIAEMPTLLHPSQPITGGQRKHAAMPSGARPHQFYLVPSRRCRNANLEAHHWARASSSTQKCQHVFALPNQSQGAIGSLQKCHSTYAPTEFGPIDQRRNVKMLSPNNQRPPPFRRNAIAIAPRN
jgi:hypothetical protein